MFQPARPQQQQARQQNGQNCASVRCQSAAESSSEDTSISRRAAIGGSLALAAAAANLQAALPAAARQVVSSDWEKVDLPVDPGVVLLDIGFTDDKHGEAIIWACTSYYAISWYMLCGSSGPCLSHYGLRDASHVS